MKEGFTSTLLRELYDLVPAKQPVFELARRLIHLPEWVYRHLHFKGIITIPVGGRCAIRLRHYGYQVENELFWAGYGHGWEATSLRLWARLAGQARTIFDIGSNTGVYALAAKAVNPAAQVFAFEPIERIARRLQGNIALNAFDIEVVVAGVSNQTGEAVIYDPATEHAYSASLNPDMLPGLSGMQENRIAVTRMDDFLAQKKLEYVDLIKIDVEKHEIEVLSGFGGAIEKLKPTFLIEVLDRDLGRKVEGFFAGIDYEFYEIIEGWEVRRVAQLGKGERNYLVCTREAASRFGLGELTRHNDILLKLA